MAAASIGVQRVAKNHSFGVDVIVLLGCFVFRKREGGLAVRRRVPTTNLAVRAFRFAWAGGAFRRPFHQRIRCTLG